MRTGTRPQEHIFRLTGEGVAVERLNVTATKIILLIKIIYRDKILGEGLNATVTNLAEIREYGKNTNPINEKLTMAEWKDALYVMSKHQIIEVPGAIQNVEDQTKIYIYSTINLYCSGVDIQALMKEYVDEEAVQKLKQAKKIFTRMLMNNWGGVSHKIMEFHEYVNLFSGKSGSGKSTVMDAIQVVLYGSISATVFK